MKITTLGIRYMKPVCPGGCKVDLGAAGDVRKICRGAGRLGETHELLHVRDRKPLACPGGRKVGLGDAQDVGKLYRGVGE